MAKRSEASKQQQRIKRLQNRGYMFPEGYKPQLGATLADIYAAAYYIDHSTPTPHVITGTERLAQERSIAARKGAETKKARSLQGLPSDVGKILAEIRRKIADWQPLEEWVSHNKKGMKPEDSAFAKIKKRDKNKLQAMLDMAIAQEGAQAVAARLEANAEMANTLATQILYGGSGDKQDFNYMQGELAGFARILLGRSLSTQESVELEQQIESFMPA